MRVVWSMQRWSVLWKSRTLTRRKLLNCKTRGGSASSPLVPHLSCESLPVLERDDSPVLERSFFESIRLRCFLLIAGVVSPIDEVAEERRMTERSAAEGD